MKTITTLFLATVAMAATAQTPPQEPTGIEKGTLGMAKATLEFLATDQKTFPAAKKTSCTNCNTYADLSTFIKDNSLKKADILVNDIKKHSLKLNDEFAADAFTSEGAVLDSLRKYVINRVTSGAERQHRTKLASYSAYQTKMMAIAGGQNPEKAVAEQADATDEARPETPAADDAAAPSSGGGSTWPLWVLSVLSLMGVGYLYWQLMQSGSRTAKADTRALETQLAGLQDDNRRLGMTVSELSNRLTMVEKRQTTASRPVEPNRPAERAADLNRPADRVQPGPNPAPSANQPRQPQQGYGPMGNNPVNPGNASASPGQQPPSPPANPSGAGAAGASALRPTPPAGQREADQLAGTSNPAAVPLSVTPPSAIPVAAAPQPVAAVPDPAAITPPAPPAAPVRLFARTADLGNGFSVSGLIDHPERGTVYELELTSPQTAQFRVSAASDAQQVAMSDPYSYLSDACLYENQPNTQSGTVRIQTLTPGKLTLQGDKWQITEKARIGFV